MSGQRAPVKLSSVVNASRYVPSTSQSSLIVGVRIRPILRTENAKGGKKDILRVIDDRVVVVLDPDESKDYLDQVQNRTKEKRYTFDIAFDSSATNLDVYDGTVRDLVSGVLYGINTTVFAYGATGSGKTHTMVGTNTDPGLMVLSLQKVFQDRDRLYADEDFVVTCSYLEVYNEVIYDLLVKNSGPLELREDPELGTQVAGLKHITVQSAEDILDLLEDGNRRRKTETTDANAQSSRSHAVLEIGIKRTPKNHYRVQQLRAKLALVDLAGSERAAETNNAGQKLRDGANINRSLLALANCINALGKATGGVGSKAGANYVPYRNSKLTRLLKDGLSGNSRTAMIATVAAAGDQYHHSINTLKYADRAKEIKTHVVQNVGTVESHIADYQRIIDNLQAEVQDLKIQLSERQTPQPGMRGSSEEDVLSMIDSLVQDMNDNIEERINLQKALFEIEDANIYNKYELKQLEEFLEAGQGGAKDIAEARDRKADVVAAIKDNDRERDKYKADISTNESTRREIQSRIDQLVNSNQNVAFLNLMSTFRLQAVRLQELKFQMAVRDQIIGEQREVISNLWRILDKSGMGRQKVLDIAKQEGIIMDGFFMLSEEKDEDGSTPRVSANGHSVGGSHASSAHGNMGLLNGAAGHVDHHVSTPNSSLAGNRAKMRYRFWAQYGGSGDTDDDHSGSSLESASHHGAEAGVRNGGPGDRQRRRPQRKAGGGPENAPGVPVRRKGGGGGVRVDPVGGGGGHMTVPAGPRRKRMQARGQFGPDDAAGAGPSGTARLGAAAGKASKNQTVPTVRSGRRAGQPAGHLRRYSDEADPEELKAELPGSKFDGPSSSPAAPSVAEPRVFVPGRRRAMSSVASAWQEPSQPVAVPVGRPPVPPAAPVPPPQPSLNERLAKLKGRLGGRKTDTDGLGDLSGEVSSREGVPSSAPTGAGRWEAGGSRPPSKGSAAGAGDIPDSLDQELARHNSRRLSSAGGS